MRINLKKARFNNDLITKILKKMNKKNINIILSALCFMDSYNQLVWLTFLAGAFWGEYIIDRFNLFETDEDQLLEDSWASQFEVNRFDEDDHKSKQ